jgi:2-methylfumaryl-CoA isomerase
MTGPATLGDQPVNHVLAAWDLLTGAYAAFALLAALRHRDATGQGQEIRIPLQDVATASVANMGMMAEVLQSGENRSRLGNDVYKAFGRDFVTADQKRLMIMAITRKQWLALINVLDIADDVAALEAERGVSFADDEGVRFDHRGALYPLVEAQVVRWAYADLEVALTNAGGCFGPYQTMLAAASDVTLVTDNPIFGMVENPSGQSYPAAGAFITIPQLTRGAVQPAPNLGGDSDAVLKRLLSLSPTDLDALKAQGLVSQT